MKKQSGISLLTSKPLTPALPGKERTERPFPTVEQLIAVCVQHINQRAAEQRVAE